MKIRRTLVAVSVALNALVLAGAAWLAFGGGAAVVGKHSLAPHHEQLVSHFSAFSISAGDVVFLGDSITEGGRWEEIFPSARTRNRGIGGEPSAGVLRRIDQLAGRNAASVFLMIGTNDLSVGTDEAVIADNVAAIVSRIRSGSPQTRVFVQSVLPRTAEFRARVESLNARLAAVAAREGADFIDLYPHFLDPADGSIRDDLSNDELHLLGAGYQVWRGRIAALVEESAALSSTPENWRSWPAPRIRGEHRSS